MSAAPSRQGLEVVAYSYEGGELPVFAEAVRWKQYVAAELAPFLRGHVLEVGAGLGWTTLAMWQQRILSWTALEPDPDLAAQAADRFARASLARASVRAGTLSAVATSERFDTILYIDVLEHIVDDVGELRRASAHLAGGGHLVVLAPAHQWLYSPFDAAIGHHRRYSAAMLRQAAPDHLVEIRLRYLDAVGVLASLGNRLLLRNAHPTSSQVRFWDRRLVPISRVVDRCLAYRLGRSVLGAWRREPLG
jgi:SAM-dependent methyltransferase